MDTKDRPKSARERLLDLARNAPATTVFSYDELNEAAGRDVRKSRSTVHGASRDLFKERGVGLVCVRGEGYQVMHADLAPSLMRSRVQNADRQIKKGLFVGDFADTDLMSADAKLRFRSVSHELDTLGKEMKQAKRRLDFHARTLADHSERLTHLEGRDRELTDEEISDFRRMMEEKRNKETVA